MIFSSFLCYNSLIMQSYMPSIDISRVTDFTRLAQEVNQSKMPREVTQGNKTLVFLMPPTTAFPSRKRQRKARKASIQRVLSLAGAWSDLPSDTMEEDLYRIRHANKPTPPIALAV
jgi:hypothetical protein